MGRCKGEEEEIVMSVYKLAEQEQTLGTNPRIKILDTIIDVIDVN